MFKNIRKLTVILLASILCLTSMMTVFAEGDKGDAGEPVGISTEEVEKLTPSSSANKNAITASPEAATVKNGETAVFTVKTSGKVRSYQWQVSKNGGKTWSKLSGKTTDTLKVAATEDLNGYQYRCKVTFKDYTVINSEPAKLTVKSGSLYATMLAADGKTCNITLDFGEDAQIPEGAELEVKEVSADDAEWMDRSVRFADAVYDQYGHVTISDLRFLSLRILADGEEIEPAAPIQIKVEYRNALNTEDIVEYEATEEKPSHFIAVHYDEAGAHVLEAENKVVDEGIAETTLWTEGLSDYDLAYVYEYKASEKATFDITYDPTGPSVMPSGNLTPNDVLRIIGKGGKASVNAEGEPSRGAGDKPEIDKTLTDNGDGTYTLGLSVTGDADTESTTAANANVVIIYDVSTSMTNNYVPMTYGGRGLDTSQASTGVDGNYFQLYRRNGNGYSAVTDEENYAGTVYRRNGNYNYTYTEYTGQRYSRTVYRADAAERVLFDFTTSLFSYQNANDPTNIQAALVVFADTNNAQVLQGWTTTRNDITRRVSSSGTSHSLTYYNYTNWEAALAEAYTELLTGNNKPDDDPTYVVFITDGAPTRSGGGTGSNTTSQYNSSSSYYVTAMNEARLVQQTCEATGGAFFGIFAFGKETDWLSSLMYYAYNGTETTQTNNGTTFETEGYYNASSAEDLQMAVDDIFQKIVNTLGVGSATISDGTTSAVQTSQGIADLLVVNEDSYQYWLSWAVTAGQNGTYTFVWNDLSTADPVTYTVTPSGENVTISWTDPEGTAKTATYKGSISFNRLTIEWLPENGKTAFYNYNAPTALYSSSKSAVDWNLTSVGTLLDSVTYTVTFEVYPSQTTLDLIADLENGYVKYEDLDPAIKPYLTPSGDTYVLETNTTATLSYEDTRTSDGPQTETFDNPPPEPVTATEMMAVSKNWSNTLDNRYDWLSQSIDLLVTRDKTPRYEVSLSDANQWKGSVAISIGIMTVDENGNVDLKTTGHDYSFAEEVAISHQWYLEADTVRPMKINNVDTMLVKVEASEAAALFAETDTNKKATSANGTYYKLTINDVVEYYKVDEAGASATLSATNHRRSYLDVVKVVDAENAPGEFTFKMTVNTHDDGADPDNINSDAWVWFSIWDPVSNSILKDQNAVSGQGLQYELENGSFNGYFYIRSGTEITVMMKKDYSLRFLNLPVGATYTIAETDMPAGYGYNFKSIEGERGYDADGIPTYKTDEDGNVILDENNHPSLVYDDWTTEAAGTVSGQSITGTIDYPESAYKVTVTNELKFFYVYHSSNNKVEQIALDDARVVNGKFNIVNEVNENYLYGGYFSTYKKTTATSSAIVALTYSEDGTVSSGVYGTKKTTGKWATDTAGQAYTGQAAAWSKGYTESGLALQVSAGAVYYLKEVPDQYFRPALYYVYDDRAEGKPILKLYLMLPTDDGYYLNVGGETDDTFTLATSTKLYSKFKVTAYDGSIEEITVNTANENLTRGYLAVWEMNDLLEKDKTYTWTPFFVTKDNVKVTSARTRTISVGDMGHGKGDGTDGHFGATDETVGSTATAAN